MAGTSRRRARLRLLVAYLRHGFRRRFRPAPDALASDLAALYAGDGLVPVTADERTRLPVMSRCISCGLCALVVKRIGEVRPPDLANAYLRDLTLLPASASDLARPDPGPHAMAAAAAVCPTGVPLAEVAAVVRRLSASPREHRQG